MGRSTTLITGATGFVGRALVRRLTADDSMRVRAAVRVRTDAVPAAVEQVTTGALSAGTDWSRATTGVSYVVHLAARAHVLRDDAVDPLLEYRRVNADATLALARQAAAEGVERFVFLSSVKVHGERTAVGRPFTERDPLSFENIVPEPYAVSKLEAERGLKDVAASTGMEVVIIRPPLVYGPGVQANFARLITAIRRGIPLPLGALSNRRSLIGVDNLVDFIGVTVVHPLAANETFLVSDGEDVSTTELVRRLARAMGRPIRLVPVPASILELGAAVLGKRDTVGRLIGSLQVDISKARTLLGWIPPVSLDEGLRRSVASIHTTMPDP